VKLYEITRATLTRVDEAFRPLTSEVVPLPTRPPMAYEHHSSQGLYCPHHHMVCYPRNQRWMVVPVGQANSWRVPSYNSVRELAAQPHVAHLPDRVLDAYEVEMAD
jgi:hypothetical protein